MSFDWKSRQNNIGKHEHVSSQVLDEETGEPGSPGGGTDLSPLTWDGQELRQTEPQLFSIVGYNNGGEVTADGGAVFIGGGDYSEDGPYGATISVLGPGALGGADLALDAGSGPVAGAGRAIFHGGRTDGIAGGVDLIGGNADNDQNGGDITLTAGAGDGGGRGGRVTVTGGVQPDGETGFVRVKGGGPSPGQITIFGTDFPGPGGSVHVGGGNAPGGSNTEGGDVVLIPGTGDGARDGLVFVYGLPTANPSVAGALWNDGGTLKVSAG